MRVPVTTVVWLVPCRSTQSQLMIQLSTFGMSIRWEVASSPLLG